MLISTTRWFNTSIPHKKRSTQARHFHQVRQCYTNPSLSHKSVISTRHFDQKRYKRALHFFRQRMLQHLCITDFTKLENIEIRIIIWEKQNIILKLERLSFISYNYSIFFYRFSICVDIVSIILYTRKFLMTKLI